MSRTHLTVRLDPDAELIVRRRMAERHVSFKQALNDAIREGARAEADAFQISVRAMGTPTVNLDQALRLAGELEDEELVRRMRRGA